MGIIEGSRRLNNKKMPKKIKCLVTKYVDICENTLNELENILTNEDIENIPTHPTLDGLQRIIDIENQTYFDRVRIIMFKLIKNGIDVTTKVSRIVEQRYDELRRRQRVSSITLTKKDTQVSSDEVKALSEQNASLQRQLDEMKKMMEQMMAMQSAPKEETAKKVDDTEKTTSTTPKKAGRPPKKTS